MPDIRDLSARVLIAWKEGRGVAHARRGLYGKLASTQCGVMLSVGAWYVAPPGTQVLCIGCLAEDCGT